MAWLRACKCRLLALSKHCATSAGCLLLEVKWTCSGRAPMTAFDPFRTLPGAGRDACQSGLPGGQEVAPDRFENFWKD